MNEIPAGFAEKKPNMDAILAAIVQAEEIQSETPRKAVTKDLLVNETNIACNKKGRLRVEIKACYLQEDVPCNISECRICEPERQDHLLTVDQTIWIPDLPVMLYGADFLWDDPAINNIFVLESFLSYLSALDMRAYLKMLRLCRIETALRQRERIFRRNQKSLDTHEAVADDRNVALFSDHVFAKTYVPRTEGMNQEARFANQIVAVAEWLCNHVQQIDRATIDEKHSVCILTSNKERKRQLKKLFSSDESAVVPVMCLDEFIKKHQSLHTGAKLSELAFAGKIAYPDATVKEDDETIADPAGYLYPQYVTSTDLATVLQEGRAYRGTIRMQPGTCFKGSILGKKTRSDKKPREIQIVGPLNVNRAISGDQVMVEVLSPTMTDNWKSVFKALGELDGTEDCHPLALDNVEVDQTMINAKLGLYGRIIAIVRRGGGTYCGTIRPRNKVIDESLNADVRELVPVNPVIPATLINCKTSQTELEEKRLVFVIDDWRRDSLLPTGHWIDNLGPVNDIDTECHVILREHGIVTKPFSKQALACLPDAGSDVSDDLNLSKRIDLRLKYCFCEECKHRRQTGKKYTGIKNASKLKPAAVEQITELLGTPCLYTVDPKREVPLARWSEGEDSKEVRSVVKALLENPKWEESELAGEYEGVWTCSIDPPTCVDIDDALSVKYLPNGNYEIGVHIADVTHFIRSESALDKEAADRCTTVYLVNQRTDMLPKILSADLCSLRSGRDRLCFSVFWEITPKGKIVRTKFWKTVIHSSAAFSYEQAQKIIDNKKDTSPIAVRLRVLLNIARIRRQNRMNRGSVELASAESKFTFVKQKDESGRLVNSADPVKVQPYEHYDTHWLIEEFMLLANVSVASRILQAFPQCSVLRRHPPPKGEALQELANALHSRLGQINFKYGSNKELSQSLNHCVDPKDPLFNRLVRQITVQCMNRATYYCTGDVTDQDSRRHYALACELYTHFTSPIRRYADVMVHRLLAAAINWETLSITSSNLQLVVNQCDKMSEKHFNAQLCQRASADYFAFRIFDRMAKNQGTSGDSGLNLHCIVTQVRRNGLCLTCPAVTIDSMCPLDGQDKRFCFEDNKWLDRKTNERIGLFDHVIVTAQPSSEDYRYKVLYRLVRKATAEEIARDAAEQMLSLGTYTSK